MKRGTEKNPNPRTVSLRKMYQALSRPVSKGYVYLKTGQILRQETYKSRKVQS